VPLSSVSTNKVFKGLSPPRKGGRENEEEEKSMSPSKVITGSSLFGGSQAANTKSKGSKKWMR